MNKSHEIYGIRATIEAINSGKTIEKVFIQKGLKGELFNQLNTLLNKNDIARSYVPLVKLNKFTKKNHQGIVAITSPIEYADFENLVISTIERGETPLFLVLDHISDVRNFGAIIRTAECTGVHGIIIPKKGAAPVTADTVKTSAGAAFKVPICKVNHIKDAVYYLQASGIKTVAATEKTDKAIYQLSLSEPLAIIMGAEDVGVSAGVLKIVDEKGKLPILGEIESLNVSVACGAILYEVVRQRMS